MSKLIEATHTGTVDTSGAMIRDADIEVSDQASGIEIKAETQVVYQDHSRIVDLMDSITELRPLYRAEWLDEYAPYRLTSAGRWDAEYEYWRRRQQLLQHVSDSSHEGDVLAELEKLFREH